MSMVRMTHVEMERMSMVVVLSTASTMCNCLSPEGGVSTAYLSKIQATFFQDANFGSFGDSWIWWSIFLARFESYVFGSYSSSDKLVSTTKKDEAVKIQ